MRKINTYMVCYDICDPKRLRHIHKTMKGFGLAIQYSIFKCTLSTKNYQIMMSKVEDEIDDDEDSILIVDLGPNEGLWEKRVTILGEKKKLKEDEQSYIF